MALQPRNNTINYLIEGNWIEPADWSNKMKRNICGYCGSQKDDRDHVSLSQLYPSSKKESKVQRITIPNCRKCNKSYEDDEVHFRNMMMLAGNPNNAVNELWHGPVTRSFEYKDGHRRSRDLVEQLVVDSTKQAKIYPGNDRRVMRVLRKIVRA